MKKKLLMAAVGAALVAGPMVAAHAAGATLYGHLHMSLDRYDNDVTEDGMLANNSSRFGIKGDEDLGGGLKAIYQLESNIVNIDDGACGLAGVSGTTCGASLRNTFVGFAGGWGAVKIGRHDTIFKELGRKLDNFNEQVGDARNVIGNASGWDNRISNMIRYDSPSFAGGLTVAVQHTSNDGSEVLGNTSQKENNVGVNWSSGPMFLGIAYSEQGTTVADQDETGIRIAGSYTFNDITLGLMWESLSDMLGLEGYDRDTMGLFASMKMGNNKFKFHWIDADTISDTDSTGGDLMAIGVDHTFSKTASVYVNYATTSNDSNNGTVVAVPGFGNVTLPKFNTASSNGGHGDNLAATNGQDASAFSVGYILKF